MKEILAGLVIAIFSLIVAVTFNILVMIHGWGLEPKSWFWIIGGSLIGAIIVPLLNLLSQSLGGDVDGNSKNP